MKRLNFDINDGLFSSFKAHCAVGGRTIKDEMTGLIRNHLGERTVEGTTCRPRRTSDSPSETSTVSLPFPLYELEGLKKVLRTLADEVGFKLLDAATFRHEDKDTWFLLVKFRRVTVDAEASVEQVD